MEIFKNEIKLIKKTTKQLQQQQQQQQQQQKTNTWNITIKIKNHHILSIGI